MVDGCSFLDSVSKLLDVLASDRVRFRSVGLSIFLATNFEYFTLKMFHSIIFNTVLTVFKNYLQIVVVFYVAIVLLLIGTNLKAGRITRSARFKQHVVEYSEGTGAANRLVPSRRNSGALIGVDQEDDIVDV